MLGKRANRGYNPKYDTKETSFICKGDSIKQVGTKQEVQRCNKDNDQNTFDADQDGESASPVKCAPGMRMNKYGELVRKVGRPPKDKSLMAKKQDQDNVKKSLKAQRYQEFRKLIAEDLKFQGLS